MNPAMAFAASIISTRAGFAAEPRSGTGLAGPSTPPPGLGANTGQVGGAPVVDLDQASGGSPG